MKTRSRSDTDDDQPRLAVLIDADNAQPSVIEGLLAEVAKYGVASVKRIYGDFTSTRMTQWKQALLKHSISPVQQFAYTSGKNATDSSLIIDAMDLLYTGRFDGFCLVSSDSDFTRLAQRLREEGPTVYGFGERKTPDAFVQACDKFIYTEVLRSEAVNSEPSKPAAAAAKPARKGRKTPHVAQAAQTAKPEATAAVASGLAAPAVQADVKADVKAAPLSAPLKLLRQAIEEASDDQGWAGLGSVGSYLNKVRPDFDPRLYGHKKLSDLLRRLSAQFELEERGNEGGSKRIFVRSRS
ncbi:NYN domain-containing protein [Xanthomonas cerealis pv. cerealis]|uniref:NYN domain-containing protein n=1 Tax=Xanthomonas cerealis TaxID=3390025 RepID=UPI001F41AB35|nr:NYN domain-containing protein [Xanthomonas translucens]UKE69674.1 NYN domain-containing protein [Xanthomonas translucens pv. pistacia]